MLYWLSLSDLAIINMELITDYLETYQGRDKFLKLLSYTARLATAISKSDEANKKLRLFGRQMSNCQVVLRLLDDIPTLHYAITYGWGRQEPDRFIRLLELVQIAVDVISSPIETICWTGEHEFISVNVDKWDSVSTLLWIISLNISFFKSLRKYSNLLKYKDLLSRSKATNNKKQMLLYYQMTNELLVCTRMLLDLGYAINYLPKGILWGGKLSIWQVGALGTLSSIIGIYQALSKRAVRKKVPD